MTAIKVLLSVSVFLLLAIIGSAQFLDRRCLAKTFQPRIIGGQNARRAPWMAYLIRKGAYVGGGSLIAHRFVLTAAHCSKVNETIYVRLGEYDLSTTQDGPTEVYQTIYIFRHPHYNVIMQVNDIAILKLDRSVVYKATIRPICIIIDPSIRSLIHRIQNFSLTGWGQTSQYYKMPTKLQQMTVRRHNYIHCYNQVDKICASNPTQFSCQGDAGSPLSAQVIYNGSTISALFGVANTVTANCKGYGIYSDVFHYTPWIVENVRRNWN
ncbi:chymotrypsin-like protease CTRL-1 [Drosophila eugracilis]|uniref:chymotrypsin-like protease CTRL-1 n=1 Tax=Drosophila eugracilis TaxID=29029 RepID=UPI0007E62139|nr:chymotrypsin-like protease CTRL-1 [Drosophila eugracilis]